MALDRQRYFDRHCLDPRHPDPRHPDARHRDSQGVQGEDDRLSRG